MSETKQIYSAMAKAFAEFEGAKKDTTNPHFGKKYADLGSVMDAVKPALAKHGLWFFQRTIPDDKGVNVETIICHVSGEHIECGQLFVPAQRADAQGFGSALTYARRYSLQSAFGIAPEDDDGNAASAQRPSGAYEATTETGPKYKPAHTMPAHVMAPKTKDVPESFKAFMSGWVKSPQGKQLWADAKQYKLAPNSLLGQYELMLACGWKESMSPDELDAMEAFLVRRTVEQAEVFKADGAAENIP